jgi:hypothetical protein
MIEIRVFWQKINRRLHRGDFLLSSGMGSENHRAHRGHRENSNSLCPPCPMWLIFFAIIRIHPEKIKKSHIGGTEFFSQRLNFVFGSGKSRV